MKLVEYRKIAKSVEDDLRAALKKHGLDLKPFGARIDERLGIVKMSLECVDSNHKAADGSSTTPERETFKQLADLYELKIEWLGQKFDFGRDAYTVEGMRRGRSVKNILIKRIRDEKVFVVEPEIVKQAFGRQPVKLAG